MKTIKRVVLKEATKLSQEEMKHVFGGSGLESGAGGCRGNNDSIYTSCSNKGEGSWCSYCILSGTQFEQLVFGLCRKPTGSVVETHKHMYCS